MRHQNIIHHIFILRSEDLVIPESMTQDFGFTAAQGKQAHSRLRNYFSSAAVESKDKSGSGIIEFSLLTDGDLPFRMSCPTQGCPRTELR